VRSKALPRASFRLDALALAVAAAALVAGVWVRRTGADGALFLTVNGWRALPDEVWATLSVAGLGVSALAALAVGARRFPGVFAALPWMLVVGGGITHVVKQLAPMPRPAAVLAAADLHLVGQRLSLRAMPSGHAMTALAVITVLFLAGGPFWRRPAIVVAGAIVAAAIGVSRVVSGAHWPADVVAGAALGWATGCVSVHLAALTRTESLLFTTAPGQWVVTASQLGAGVAVALDQGYGRTLPLQWVLATLAIWSGVRVISVRGFGRVSARPPAEVRT
jgi:membrane-associated phospholipid phosphatase